MPAEWAMQYQQFVIPSSNPTPLPNGNTLDSRSFSVGSHSSFTGSLSPVSATSPHSHNSQPLKKKAGRKPTTEAPKDKRIAQNRASQKTYREKQQAYVKSLEEKVALCEASHSNLNDGGHAQSPPTTGLIYNNNQPNAQNTVLTANMNMINTMEWSQRVTALEMDNLKLKTELQAYTEALRIQTRKIEQQDAIIQQYQSMALSLMSAPPKPDMSSSLFQDPFSILSYPPLNQGFSMPTTTTMDSLSYYPTVTVPSQPANANGNGLASMQSVDSLATLAQRTSGFFNLASTAAAAPFAFLNSPPAPSSLPQQTSSIRDSLTPSLRTKPSVTSNLSENWDLSQLDALRNSQERTDVGRQLLKTVPSLQNENGARLVDDLCDMFNEMTVRQSYSHPERVPTPDRIDKNLLKICMTKLQILEACSEEDQEKVIALTQYTGKKNTFVKKHFTGFVKIIRNTIGLGKQQF
ncbi:UNVERIFIED_CONTAM: hypothetical protein HDU68_005769 [Siphonaria sp. JEL0065]|nr:hypothetical protein HDU68_005769 [Siphonaria sp. JEL0065]